MSEERKNMSASLRRRSARVLSELRMSWPSLIVAIFATVGYVLVGRKVAIGWLANLVANLALVLTGLRARQWGLMWSLIFAVLAAWNFVQWTR